MTGDELALLLADGEVQLLDVRGAAEYDGTGGYPCDPVQGHIPGALHLPHAEIKERAPGLLDPAVPVVAYCWGPGCNGATRAALALAEAGFAAREMLGGIEYWIREGFPVTTAAGDVVQEPDRLTAVCGC